VEISKNLVTLVDVAIPVNKRILERNRTEKITKYQDLMIELECLWKKQTRIFPVVIEVLGAISGHINVS